MRSVTLAAMAIRSSAHSLPPTYRPHYTAEVAKAVAAMADAGLEERGAIFTKPCIVDLILDLVGYTDDRPLYEFTLLEPSCGTGRFLLSALDRLLVTWERAGRPKCNLQRCLRAVELHRETSDALFDALLDRLLTAGFSQSEARQLCDSWLIQDDFLLLDRLPHFDFVVGNPPYLRQEKINPVLLARQAYAVP